MSVDPSRFVTAAKTAIREHAGDLLRGLPSADRAVYLEDEAQNLAGALAEMTEERVQELRASLREEMAA